MKIKHDAGGLPPPDAVARSHSERLAAHIRAEMSRCGGALPFTRYMELALYAPGLGYYSAGSRKFGAEGDFVTAPELSPLFSQCVARQCAQVLEILQGGSILEFGAGSGAMAAQIMQQLDALQCLPREYGILELSADLRQRQQERLAALPARLGERVRWLDAMPAPGFVGVMLANEVLDAMPVHRFVIGERDIRESDVCWDRDRFAWSERPLVSGEVLERVERLRAQLGPGTLYSGYTSEINLAGEAWLRSVAQSLKRGVLLLIDYGFPRREYYLPDRSGGTLMCHYRHRSHTDPLVHVGLQDITAHVDFTAIAEAALVFELDVLGYTTQAQFLINTGLLDALARSDPNDTRAHWALAQQVKRLTLPSEMGELFKVLALGRGIDEPLSGFGRGDQRGRL